MLATHRELVRGARRGARHGTFMNRLVDPPLQSQKITITVDEGLADDSARGHGRVLCVRGGARSAGAERQAADRRRYRRPRGGRGRQLRGAPFRRALGDADARGAAALPAGGVRRARAWRAIKRFPRKCSRFFANSRRWWRGCPWTRRFSMSSAGQRLLGSPETIGGEIRRRIRAATQLTASVGIASNKLLAKIASDLSKPDGMCRIGPENMQGILDRIAHRKAVRSGPKIAAGRPCSGNPHVRRLAAEPGRRPCGAPSASMGSPCRPSPLESTTGRWLRIGEEQSISAEETFATDIRDTAELGRQLTRLADRTAARLRAHGLVARPGHRQDSTSGFRDVYASARARAADARYRRDLRPGATRCCRHGWARTRMRRCDCWGSGAGDLQRPRQGRSVCGAAAQGVRGSMRPSTAFGTDSGPRR